MRGVNLQQQLLAAQHVEQRHGRGSSSAANKQALPVA